METLQQTTTELSQKQRELLAFSEDCYSLNIEEAKLFYSQETVKQLKKLVALGYLSITEFGEYKYTGKPYL